LMPAQDAAGQEVQVTPDGPSVVSGVAIKRDGHEPPTTMPGGLRAAGRHQTAATSLLTLSLVGLMTSVLSAATGLVAQSVNVVLRLPASANIGTWLNLHHHHHHHHHVIYLMLTKRSKVHEVIYIIDKNANEIKYKLNESGNAVHELKLTNVSAIEVSTNLNKLLQSCQCSVGPLSGAHLPSEALKFELVCG